MDAHSESKKDIRRTKAGEIIAIVYEGFGKIPEFNRDVDRVYEYLYKNNLQDKISGPTIGLFYTETGGKYKVAIPLLDKVSVGPKMKIEKLPAIDCLEVLHGENLETMDESFAKIKEYIAKHNLEFQFPIRETYIPLEHGKYITKIQVPVREK